MKTALELVDVVILDSDDAGLVENYRLPLSICVTKSAVFTIGSFSTFVVNIRCRQFN